MNNAAEYLNTYISPSNLISISIFEDDHPNAHNIYNLVILHKGKGDSPLDKKDIKGDIYSVKFHNFDKGWEHLGEAVIKDIDEGGFT